VKLGDLKKDFNSVNFSGPNSLILTEKYEKIPS
jgi:hypothetical protein